jgi:mono/diheme cytochrome c family protein
MFRGSERLPVAGSQLPRDGGALAKVPRRPATGNRQPRRHALLLVLAVALLAAACERTGPSFQKMGRQPKYDPYEPSDFFADGMSARPRIAGTVARGEISGNPFMDSGKIGGQDGDGFPMPVTAQVLNRGHERFNIYCSECHGRVGDGNGMIPSRGYRRPPSFHTEALRNAKTGHFFDVMTNGFGAMPPYAVQVPVADRWAIIAYIRALQLSQNGTMNDVPAEERAKMGMSAAPAASASATSNPQPATMTGVAQ